MRDEARTAKDGLANRDRGPARDGCRSRPFIAALALQFAALALALLATAGTAHAWPSDGQWIELVKGGGPIQDNERDANGGVNVVPTDGSHAAAYIANDGTYLYYRIRLDAPPDGGGNGVLAQFGWGFELDTDQNADTYEWLMMCDGISSPEIVALYQNTVQRQLGQPSDDSEILTASWPLVGNHRILLADTSINGDPDYFLDYRIPLATFRSVTGITDSTLIRYFVGSSRSTNNLTENGADLVAGSTLYEGLSDYITVSGTLPPGTSFRDGTVAFAADIAGFGDRTMTAPGETLFVRVDDLDLNATTLPGGQLWVRLDSPSGDYEMLALTPTGVAGKYTGSIPTTTALSAPRDGALQVASGQTITVTYTDAVAADRSQNVSRTDTLLITATGTDVGLTKTVNDPNPDEGASITFTVTATNYGPNTATGLRVTDLLPSGLTFVSAAPSGTTTYSAANGLWNLGSLARDASATLTVTATVNAGTSRQVITNTAAVSAIAQTDSNGANDSASATVKVRGTDLRVMKTVDKPSPAVGDQVTYTIEVRNLGPAATTGVQVTDLIPAGLTFQGATPTQGAYASGTGVWTAGALEVGAAARLTLVATVNAGTAGQTLTNTASLTATAQPDTYATNNSASASIRVGFVDLSVAKTVNNSGPTPNSNVTYEVRVTNNGPIGATGVVVTDLLPAGLTYLSHAATHGSYASGTGLWAVGALANGVTATLTLNARVNGGTTGQTLVNEARLTGHDQPDGNASNNVASAVVAVGGTDIRLAKSVSNATPGVGATVTWAITVTNAGPSAADGIGVTDLLPAGVSGLKTGNDIQYTATQGSFSNANGVWSVGSLAVGASATLSIPTTVDNGTSGRNITNVAMLTSLTQADPNDANNVASATIAVAGTDLAITKAVDNPTPNTGQTIVYTLVARNNGPNAATGVVVKDLLPPELVYVSHAPASASYVASTGVWTVGALANGATTTLTISARVRNEDRRLTITNTASIDSPTQGDPVPGNDTASADINVAATDLRISKAVDNASPGERGTIVYTVSVTNLGSNAATGVEVQDALPAGVTMTSAAASQGTYSSGLWLVGTVASAATATLTISAQVNAGTAGTTITNTATLVRLEQIDPSPANDSASVSVNPRYIPPPSLTMVKTADVASANPGDVITYTLVVANSGPGAAHELVLTDKLSPFTALSLDAWGAGAAFQFIDGAPASGVTLGTPTYSDDAGATYAHAAVSGGGGAPAGYDGAITHWKQVMSGTLQPGRSFTLRYKTRVK